MPNAIDIKGQRFGGLIVIGRPIYNDRKFGESRMWTCVCDCGKITSGCTALLRKGEKKSCGCYQRDIARERVKGSSFDQTTHGMSHLPEFKLWQNMVRRCSKHCSHSEHYFDRGIRVCDSWSNILTGFPQFIKDMGSRPSAEHTLDRIDVNGNYEPSNCRWSTWDVQANNKRKRARIDQYSTDELVTELKKRGVNALN